MGQVEGGWVGKRVPAPLLAILLCLGQEGSLMLLELSAEEGSSRGQMMVIKWCTGEPSGAPWSD